jgi:NADH-quinone oxidoreductase subunit H
VEEYITRMHHDYSLSTVVDLCKVNKNNNVLVSTTITKIWNRAMICSDFQLLFGPGYSSDTSGDGPGIELSNSIKCKYAFLGCLRSAAQMVSYEVSIGLIIITVLLCVGSLNLSEIVMAQKEIWFCIPLFPLLILFFVSCLAETNRAPFDLPEAEAELVAGYNVEYSSMGFALFFLGEYANMIMMSGMCSILFLGGWLPPFDFVIFYWIPAGFWFGLKIIFFLFIYIWVRAAFPRYRYDQLMRLGWKVFLPLSLAWVVFVAGTLLSFDWLPGF